VFDTWPTVGGLFYPCEVWEIPSWSWQDMTVLSHPNRVPFSLHWRPFCPVRTRWRKWLMWWRWCLLEGLDWGLGPQRVRRLWKEGNNTVIESTYLHEFGRGNEGYE